jgi:hypothetical protein
LGAATFKRTKKVLQTGAEMGRLKFEHPEAWALGEAFAAEAFDTRSPDLIQMIHQRGQEGRDAYAREIAHMAVVGVTSGEIEADFPPSQQALEAVGIACGTALIDALEKEGRG